MWNGNRWLVISKTSAMEILYLRYFALLMRTYRHMVGSYYRFRDFSFTQNVAAKHPKPKSNEGIKAATVAT